MFYAVAFALFAMVCTVLAFIRHPIYGLYFYLATTFVYPPSRWWGTMLPDLRWALLSALITAMAILLRQGKLRTKPVWLANAPAATAILYSLWLWAQTPWALDLQTHLDGSLQFTKYLLAFWMIYCVMDSKEHLRDVLLAHVLGCLLSSPDATAIVSMASAAPASTTPTRWACTWRRGSSSAWAYSCRKPVGGVT
jgi:hypothetical protein